MGRGKYILTRIKDINQFKHKILKKMKTLLTRFLLVTGLSLFLLSSCKKDDNLIQATSGTPAVLTASTPNLVLTKNIATNAAINFNWSNANYGYNAAITNVLQIDVKGNNFSKPKEIATTTAYKNYNVIDFNSILLGLGLPTGVNSIIETRVKSSISSNIAPIYSNVVSVTVNPYALTSFVYVPGDYQGWSPSTADSLISATSNGIYTGVINYPAGGSFQFKVTPAKNWNIAYGYASATTISTSGGNLYVPNAGSFQVTIDLNANTWSTTPLLWSVIGDATPGGWGSDTDLKYNNGTQTWSAVVPLIGGKAIKFRKNHDWGTNYGSVTTPGTLDQANNNNIAVGATGNYLITIDLVHLTYTLVKQ